jgi:hypothetical protein
MRCNLMAAASTTVLFLSGQLLAADRVEGTALLTAQAPDGTITGWKSFHDPLVKTGEVWKLSNGVLSCKGSPMGYLFTEKAYTDFVLALEWRSPPGAKPGSGGVLLRMSGKDKIWPKSLEAQLNAGSEGDFWGLDGFELGGSAERLKRMRHEQFGKLVNLPRIKNAVKMPGEWNRYEIIAVDRTVTLKINDKEVNQATCCDVIAGPICLTAEGDRIEFREIQVRER